MLTTFLLLWLLASDALFGFPLDIIIWMDTCFLVSDSFIFGFFFSDQFRVNTIDFTSIVELMVSMPNNCTCLCGVLGNGAAAREQMMKKKPSIYSSFQTMWTITFSRLLMLRRFALRCYIALTLSVLLFCCSVWIYVCDQASYPIAHSWIFSLH